MLEFLMSLGLKKLRERGDNIMFCCPFHGENVPSAGISITKNVGHCFSCGESFTLVKLTAFCLNLSIDEAKAFIGDNLSSVEKESYSFPLYGEVCKQEEYLPYYSLAKYHSGEITHDYLLDRGFTTEDFKNFKLGYDNDLRRITIPFFNRNKELLGFVGRAVLSESNPNFTKIYPYGSKYYVYEPLKTGDTLFCIDRFKPIENSIILVEGLLDALRLHSLGYSNALSTATASVSKRQIELLKELEVDTFILGYDNDKAGERGNKNVYNALKYAGFKFKCVQYSLVGKKDFGDCNKEEVDYLLINLKDYPTFNFPMLE